MILKDSNGAEYDLVPFEAMAWNGSSAKPTPISAYALKPIEPIKEAKKDNYTLAFGRTYWDVEEKQKPWLLQQTDDFTPPQAEAIAKAIEWLLETIISDVHYADHIDGRSSLNEAIFKARKAYHE